MTWTKAQLREWLVAQGIPDNYIKTRFGAYCLPKLEALAGFRAAFAAEQSGKRLSTYSNKNNCSAFALRADSAVRDQWLWTPDTPEAWIAFGWGEGFLNVDGHAFNCGVFDVNGKPTLLYFEPQAALSEVQIRDVTWCEI